MIARYNFTKKVFSKLPSPHSTSCLGIRNFKFPLTVGVVTSIARSAASNSTKGFSFASAKMLESLPHFATGEIVRGFGRGSKELGIPTANFPLDVVKALPSEFITGVYYGYSSVDNGPVYKMVMSVGWNPFYENKEKSMETHILHDFNRDLYGCILKVCVVGYLRPEKNFDSLEELIATIKDDIQQAEALLDKPENQHCKDLDFFKDTTTSTAEMDKSNGHT